MQNNSVLYDLESSISLANRICNLFNAIYLYIDELRILANSYENDLCLLTFNNQEYQMQVGFRSELRLAINESFYLRNVIMNTVSISKNDSLFMINTDSNELYISADDRDIFNIDDISLSEEWFFQQSTVLDNVSIMRRIVVKYIITNSKFKYLRINTRDLKFYEQFMKRNNFM